MKIDKSRRFENYNVADGRYEQRVRWPRSMLDYQFATAPACTTPCTSTRPSAITAT
jgi:hypothetical protein